MAKKKIQASAGMSAALSKYQVTKPLKCIKTDVEALNTIWGGGIHLGYMYSMWGEAGCGKSTLDLQVVKSFCKQGLKCIIIDVEKAVNELQQASFGLGEYVESGLLDIVTIDNYAELEDLCINIAESKAYSLVMIDSLTAVAAKVPKDLTVEDVRPGLRATQESFVLQKVKPLFFYADIASLVIFHAKANIVMTGGTQPLTKQAGGYAAGHYPDVITQLSTHSKVKGEDDAFIGVEITMMTTKNKFCAPFQPLKKKLIYGKGISARIDLIDSCLEAGLIKQSGAYFIMESIDVKVCGRVALYDLPADKMRALKLAYQNSGQGAKEVEEVQESNEVEATGMEASE